MDPDQPSTVGQEQLPEHVTVAPPYVPAGHAEQAVEALLPAGEVDPAMIPSRQLAARILSLSRLSCVVASGGP